MARFPRRPVHDGPDRVEIREPTISDAEALGRMHYAAWREAYSDLLPTDFWSDAAERRRIDSWAHHLATAEPDVTVRIAARLAAGTDGPVVGFAMSGPGRPNESAGRPVRERELYAMYVRRREYGTGLAHALLDAVLPADEPAQLWVFEANPRARAFYEKHGFVADGARHLFGKEYGDQPEIRMVR